MGKDLKGKELGAGISQSLERRKPNKIKVFKEDIDKNETRNRWTSKCWKKYFI